jgi:hypothetical protein
VGSAPDAARAMATAGASGGWRNYENSEAFVRRASPTSKLDSVPARLRDAVDCVERRRRIPRRISRLRAELDALPGRLNKMQARFPRGRGGSRKILMALNLCRG